MQTFFSLLLFFFFSFFSLQGQGTWTQKANFGGTARVGAIGFSIGTKGYIGTGADNTGNNKNDFWEYDPSNDSWTQKADFGSTPRKFAVGFSIGSKGYVGTGADNNNDTIDLWEYDQFSNSWVAKANLPASPRERAIAFSIGSNGFIGIGSYGPMYNSDFWKYNSATNIWTQKANFSGKARQEAVGFSIGAKGYIATGYQITTPPSYFINALWEYDTTMNTWTQKADFIGTARRNAIGFSIGTKAYIGTGFDSTANYKNDFWEYDQAINTWLQKTNLPASQRAYAIGFSIGTKGYIGTGTDGATMLNDFWEYDTSGNGINEVDFGNLIYIYPNPSNGIFSLTSNNKISSIEIFSVLGEKINSAKTEIDLSKEGKGIYFYKITTEKENIATGKLIVQ